MLDSEHIFNLIIDSGDIPLFEESTIISLDNLVINKAYKRFTYEFFSHVYKSK